MPFDDKLKRFVSFIRGDVARMLERQQQRTAGYDGVRYSEDEGLVTYFRQGQALWRAKAELIGTFSPELGLYRFSWAARHGTTSARARVDLALREAQRFGMHDIASDQMYVDGEPEAEIISGIVAQLSRADGILRTDDGPRFAYLALYDEKNAATAPTSGLARDPSEELRKSRLSNVPNQPIELSTGDGVRAAGFRPAAVGDARGFKAPTTSAPPPANTDPGRRGPTPSRMPPAPSIPMSRNPTPSRLPNVGGLGEHLVTPRPSLYSGPQQPAAPTPAPAGSITVGPRADGSGGFPAVVRDPSRELFRPVAQLALGALMNRFTNGFHQAIVLVNVDAVDARLRFSVSILAADERHDLYVLDPSRELLEAVGKLLAEDVREGNGRWRRLSARLTPTARGVSVDMETK